MILAPVRGVRLPYALREGLREHSPPRLASALFLSGPHEGAALTPSGQDPAAPAALGEPQLRHSMPE